jgi:hypothetical protein
MSKRRMSSMATNSGGTLHAGVLAQHNANVQKARLLEEQAKRKEQAKKPKRKLDYYFKKCSNLEAKGVTAFTLVISGKKVNTQSIKDNYDIGVSTLQRYKTWVDNGMPNDSAYHINSFVLANKEELIEVIKHSPALTIKESKRLYELARPLGFNIVTGKVPPSKLKPKKEDTTEDYDHMLSKEQKVELMDLANLELSEVKPITKSDVVVGVIVGAVVGASMAAYLFITNGAI